MLTFQKIIESLTTFWASKGCIIHQGHDVEVGAGTFNPATFLRCLGPEPYNTAYVEPSRRPSDARYGQNPNRIHCFHQFQVILKPSPKDVLPLYLASLEALHLNLKEHDIRFVHDDWESPTVGAWGLGWEVWCDGMEITQFTYFQAMGSLELNPISAEITYGLERLAMFIQNKDSIFDVQWNEHLTMGDIIKGSEIEWSTYNFQAASIPMWKTHFDDFEQEARRLIEQGLPLPAYDFVIKASHAFNMLGARGAISVTERTGYISKIRDLSRLIASAYVESREKLGFPLLKSTPATPSQPPLTLDTIPPFNSEKSQDFLLEIGSEQLPATFVPIGLACLEKTVRAFLQAHSLHFDTLEMFGTPRRLGLIVRGLTEGTQTASIEKKGPPVSAVFTPQGSLTPQGAGFLRSLGLPEVSLEGVKAGHFPQLQIKKIKEIDYLFATLVQQGQSTLALLSAAIPTFITHIDFPKNMHWDDTSVTYARPLRWIVALFGNTVIPCQIGHVHSSNLSYGHAQLDPSSFTISTPTTFLSLLKSHYVLASVKERKESIEQQIATLEKENNSIAVEPERVLKQVLHLTEWPAVMLGSFQPAFLRAPKEVLISEMVEHQKYFPLANQSGELLPHFLITADNAPGPLIRRGNERVLSARLSDGVFLYEQDCQIPLAQYNEKLKVMVHQKELGSMFDKVVRIQQITKEMERHLGLTPSAKVERAALLCKADLASALVGEFPELQGVIGKYYALEQKEDPEVASAIEEHWMPRFEGAPLPHSQTGMVVSLSDKIDNLISCYSTGLKPSSSSDPYALRRQMIGLLKILIQDKRRINLHKLITSCCSYFPHLKESSALVQEMIQFITARAYSVFEEQGFKREEIAACLKGACLDPYDDYRKVEALHAFRSSGKAFTSLVEVYKRAKGQLETRSPTPFTRALLQEEAEKALADALEKIQLQWKELLNKSQYAEALTCVATLQPLLANLFDHVRILCDDKDLKNNRIALLQQVFDLIRELIDLKEI